MGAVTDAAQSVSRLNIQLNTCAKAWGKPSMELSKTEDKYA